MFKTFYRGQANLLMRSCIEAIHPRLALASDASKSLARRRLRLSHAKVRSTTQRRSGESANHRFPGGGWSRLDLFIDPAGAAYFA
jgi:hypothetical protein